MKFVLLAAATLALAPAVHAAPSSSRAGSPELAAVIADYDQVEKRFHPGAAAQDGDREALSRLDDDSPEAEAQERRP